MKNTHLLNERCNQLIQREDIVSLECKKGNKFVVSITHIRKSKKEERIDNYCRNAAMHGCTVAFKAESRVHVRK